MATIYSPDDKSDKLAKSRSYKTRAALEKKLTQLCFANEYGYVIVRRQDGRYTAIFSFSTWGAGPAHLGFYTMN